VLEHQAAPVEFLQKVKASCGRRCNRSERAESRTWLTGPDVLDYPPNHFLRWNAAALRKFLSAQGLRSYPFASSRPGSRTRADDAYGAAHGDIASCGGRSIDELSRHDANDARSGEAVLRAKPTTRQRAMVFWDESNLPHASLWR